MAGPVARVRGRAGHGEVPAALVQDAPGPAALGGGLAALEVDLGAVAAPGVAGVAVPAGDAQRVLGVQDEGGLAVGVALLMLLQWICCLLLLLLLLEV